MLFEIQYCDPNYLQSIHSDKECKDKDTIWEWLKQVEFNVHYKKQFFDINKFPDKYPIQSDESELLHDEILKIL